ncbi:MAG: hypothetical protein KBO60_19740 [Achromobacter sp.]|uniref:hypothetical protein n=1 Tax=Achromobacter TaxID=222 RepID=UPI000A430BAE|nr:hypothetical protein [Achromobacter sp. 2789STDY5608621]MCG2605293.1 hypothetical protein [Achromobacter sp.]
MIPDFKARAILPPTGGVRGQADACSAKIGRRRCAVQIQTTLKKADQFGAWVDPGPHRHRGNRVNGMKGPDHGVTKKAAQQ